MSSYKRLRLLPDRNDEGERDYLNLLHLKRQWFLIKLELDRLGTFERLKKVKKIYPKRYAVWGRI